MVERKLGEMLNRHGGRRARYWGTSKILIQELMAALATNVKQIVRWLCADGGRGVRILTKPPRSAQKTQDR